MPGTFQASSIGCYKMCEKFWTLPIGIFLTQVVVHIVGNPLFQACKGQGAAHLLHPAHVGLRKILVFSPDNVRYFSHIEKIEVAHQVG